MPKLTDYTTDELKRLTTLTFSDCKPGEFAHVLESFGITPQLRLTNGQITDASGSTGIPGGYAPVRRVRSFTDSTELDPPQAEMLAELCRREQSANAAKAFKVGDTVRYGTMIATVTGFSGGSNESTRVNIAEQVGAPLQQVVDPHTLTKVSPPTPAISNATHAGRRVRSGSGETGIVVSSWAAHKLYPNAEEVVWVSDRTGGAKIITLGELTLLD